MYNIISAKHITESEWHGYFEMSQELNEKYYPDRFNKNETFNNFKAQILDSYNKTKGYDNYLIKREGLPVGWFYTTTWGGVLYAGLYVNSDEITNDLLREFLLLVRELMKKLNYHEFYTSSYRQANIDLFKNLNAEITQEFVSSQLLNSEINARKLNEIVTDFSIPDCRIIYCGKIEEELSDSYLECFNIAFSDMMKLNKTILKYEPFTKEQLISNQNSGSDKRIILLLDTAINVLGFSELYYIKERIFFSCDSGFTAVHPAYRGKGIAKYLKASLYLRLLSESVEFDRITTNTLKYNNFVNKINLELGFKEYRRGYSFRLTKEIIENNLNNIE